MKVRLKIGGTFRVRGLRIIKWKCVSWVTMSGSQSHSLYCALALPSWHFSFLFMSSNQKQEPVSFPPRSRGESAFADCSTASKSYRTCSVFLSSKSPRPDPEQSVPLLVLSTWSGAVLFIQSWRYDSRVHLGDGLTLGEGYSRPGGDGVRLNLIYCSCFSLHQMIWWFPFWISGFLQGRRLQLDFCVC